MPIAGLSEQRRLPRLGKLHLGVKKQSASSGKEYPSATDYFVVPPDVAKLVGDKPTELPIMIPLEDDEIWASQYYKRYSRTRGLVCKGDGITCKRMIDTATGDTANRDTKEIVWKEGMSCEGKNCPSYKSKECREVMHLQFIMPDVPGLGVWQVDTSSINSIRNINSAATMIRAVYKRITMLPLLLTLEPMEVNNPDDGKKKTVRVLNLRVRGTMRELMLQAGKPVTELLLPAPVETEAPLDTEEISVTDAEVIDAIYEGKRSTIVPSKVINVTAEVVIDNPFNDQQNNKMTYEELADKVMVNMGWKDTKIVKSWLVNACKIPLDRIANDPSGVWQDVCKLKDWK